MSQFTNQSGVDARLARKRMKTEAFHQVFEVAYGGKPEVIQHLYSEVEEQTIARLAMTAVLQSDQNRTEDQMVREMVQHLQTIKDPLFVLKAMAVSRRANFKLFPKVAAAALVAQRENIYNWYVYEPQLVKMLATLPPNQLLELVLIIKSKLFGKGLGSYEQRLIGSVMKSWSSDRLEDFTLSSAGDMQRLMRLVHPNLPTVSSFCLDGKPPVTMRQSAQKSLSEVSPVAQAHLIRENKLPFNYTKGVVPNANTQAWEAIRDNMSPLQLLINLRALDEKGVMTPEKLKAALVGAEDSRLLPVDVLRPVVNASPQYAEELMSLLSRMAPVPLPGLEDLDIAVLLDGSGSMMWTGANGYSPEKGGVTNWMRGIVMAAPLLALKRRHFMIFDTVPRPEGCNIPGHRVNGTPFLKGCPKEAILHNLLHACPQGGTSTNLAVDWYTQNQQRVDVMFIITDENQNGHQAALKSFYRYQQVVNPDAKLVIVNCTNTTWHMANENHKDVKIIQAMTPLVYTMFENYNTSTVELIRNWKL